MVWWDRAVAAFPPYVEYQEKTSRKIPLVGQSRFPERARSETV
ncbi:MAG: hypothetical protein ACP5HZ_09900 [Ferrimicrobium sp.]